MTAATRHPRSLYPLLGLMVFCWSANYIAGKVALRSFPPLLLGTVRTTLAGVMMLPVYAWARRSTGQGSWKAADVLVLLPLGVLGIAMNQILFVAGLSLTSVAHAAILSGLTPMLVLGIASLAGMERFAPRRVFGMCVALSGVALINAVPSKAGHSSALGNLLVLLGTLTFAVFTVAGKRYTAQFGAITVCTFGYTGGALVLAPMTWWLLHDFAWGAVSAASWTAMLFMAAFPAVVCYIIYYWALNYTAASRVAALSYLQPPLATLMAVPLLGEPIPAVVVAGGTLVLSGVYLSGRK